MRWRAAEIRARERWNESRREPGCGGADAASLMLRF